MKFLNMIFFHIHQEREKMRKNLVINYGGFWCGIMNIDNKKHFHMMPKKKREKHTF